VKHYCLRSINSLTPFVKRKTALSIKRVHYCANSQKDDKTDCNNYRGISLLSTSYNILWNIHISRLSPYIDEIIGDDHCGFRCKRSEFLSSSHTEEKWKCNERVHKLFTDFKKTYDPVRMEVLYNILTEFGIPMKIVRLFTMRLNETHSKVRVGKHLFNGFPMQNSLK
jgi:hypothetical protein